MGHSRVRDTGAAVLLSKGMARLPLAVLLTCALSSAEPIHLYSFVQVE